MANKGPVVRKNFLGKGIKFPFGFTQRTGGVYKGTSTEESEDVQHIQQSIRQILDTVIESRVIRRDFGSLLASIVFDPNDVTLDVRLDYIIRRAIETWEPRVIIGPITTDRSEWQDGRLYINISFTIIKINVASNMVFDWFLSPEERKTYVTPGR